MLMLKVDDMTCDHCVRAVEKAVREVDPSAEVAIDLGSGTVNVASRADTVLIGEAILSAGYPNRPIAA